MSAGSCSSSLVTFSALVLFSLSSLLIITCGGGGSGGGSESSDISTDSPSGESEETTNGGDVPSGNVVEGEWSGLFYNDAGVECPAEDASPLVGDTIYVSNSGSDDNSGADESNALKTIRMALCNVSPGQTIKIMPGTYSESVIAYGFGSEDSPITISGVESNGVKPVLDGQNRLTMAIAVVNGNNFVIENLKFTNYTDEGVLVVLSSKITVKNNEFIKNGSASVEPDNNGEGFGIQLTDCTDVLIENNSVYENGPGPARQAEGKLGTGIDTFGMVNGIIRGNSSSRNIGGGILVEDGNNVLVENNSIEENQGVSIDWFDTGIWLDGGQNITVRNNIIRNNIGAGVLIADTDLQYPANSKGYIVENNIITGNYWGLYTYNYGSCFMPPPDVLTWRNNTVENNSYSGPGEDDWQYDEASQTLCVEWPCGVNTPCI